MTDPAPYPSLNVLLGFDKDTRVLLVNADDAGMCHAANLAIIDVFAAGIVKSTTAMVPAPHFAEFAHLVGEHPEIRYGIHLTVTSEWDSVRWGPVAPREKVPSLLDEQGCFYHSEHDFLHHAQVDEVELEFRAQLERAFEAGLKPTHIDSHMGAYHWDERFFQVAKALADEFGLTMRIGYAPRRDVLRAEGWAVPDRLIWETYDVPDDDREPFYRENFRRLTPGVTEMLIHPARSCAELESICTCTAGYRSFDHAFFTNPETKAFLEAEGIVCIGYDDLLKVHRRS